MDSIRWIWRSDAHLVSSNEGAFLLSAAGATVVRGTSAAQWAKSLQKAFRAGASISDLAAGLSKEQDAILRRMVSLLKRVDAIAETIDASDGGLDGAVEPATDAPGGRGSTPRVIGRLDGRGEMNDPLEIALRLTGIPRGDDLQEPTDPLVGRESSRLELQARDSGRLRCASIVQVGSALTVAFRDPSDGNSVLTAHAVTARWREARVRLAPTPAQSTAAAAYAVTGAALQVESDDPVATRRVLVVDRRGLTRETGCWAHPFDSAQPAEDPQAVVERVRRLESGTVVDPADGHHPREGLDSGPFAVLASVASPLREESLVYRSASVGDTIAHGCGSTVAEKTIHVASSTARGAERGLLQWGLFEHQLSMPDPRRFFLREEPLVRGEPSATDLYAALRSLPDNAVTYGVRIDSGLRIPVPVGEAYPRLPRSRSRRWRATGNGVGATWNAALVSAMGAAICIAHNAARTRSTDSRATGWDAIELTAQSHVVRAILKERHTDPMLTHEGMFLGVPILRLSLPSGTLVRFAYTDESAAERALIDLAMKATNASWVDTVHPVAESLVAESAVRDNSVALASIREALDRSGYCAAVVPLDVDAAAAAVSPYNARVIITRKDC